MERTKQRNGTGKQYTRETARLAGLNAAEFLFVTGRTGDVVQLQKAGDGRIMTRVFRADGEDVSETGEWRTCGPSGEWVIDRRLDGAPVELIVGMVAAATPQGDMITIQWRGGMVSIHGVITPDGQVWTRATGWASAI